MTSKYVPFLKLKPNEIMAVKELDADLRQALTPFFDFPYKKSRTEDDFRNTAVKRFGSITKHLEDIPYFYLDNYDVNSNLTVDGNNSYAYLLSIFKDLPIVPVIAIDRSPEHMQAVCEAKDSGELKSDRIALRFGAEDFGDFDVVSDDIDVLLGDTLSRFVDVDIVLDCRVCLNHDLASLTSSIVYFIEEFSDAYLVDNVIVTGSSIPPSIGEILSVGEEVEWPRLELDIFDGVCNVIGDGFDVVLGDYGIVSPNYSDLDIPPELFQNVMTAKTLYTFDRHHFIIRGGAIKTHERGNQQFFDQAAVIADKTFYRGSGYSWGDNFIDEKSRSEGSLVTNATIIKPTVNLHMSYMLKDYA